MAQIGVFAVILDEQQRVLLCHRRDRDLWNLPGGGLERGEPPWEGVRREVKEEVGLDVAIERLAGIYSKPDEDEIVFSFVCAIRGGEITTSDEADAVQYFRLDEIPQNSSSKQVERIRDVLSCPDQLVLKVQRQ